MGQGTQKIEGVLLKKQGRVPLKVPSKRDSCILDALKSGFSQAEVGRVYGLSRQCVFQIKTRWPNLCA